MKRFNYARNISQAQNRKLFARPKPKTAIFHLHCVSTSFTSQRVKCNFNVWTIQAIETHKIKCEI